MIHIGAQKFVLSAYIAESKVSSLNSQEVGFEADGTTGTITRTCQSTLLIKMVMYITPLLASTSSTRNFNSSLSAAKLACPVAGDHIPKVDI